MKNIRNQNMIQTLRFLFFMIVLISCNSNQNNKYLDVDKALETTLYLENANNTCMFKYLRRDSLALERMNEIEDSIKTYNYDSVVALVKYQRYNTLNPHFHSGELDTSLYKRQKYSVLYETQACLNKLYFPNIIKLTYCIIKSHKVIRIYHSGFGLESSICYDTLKNDIDLFALHRLDLTENYLNYGEYDYFTIIYDTLKIHTDYGNICWDGSNSQNFILEYLKDICYNLPTDVW